MLNAMEQTQFKVQSHLPLLWALVWMDELCTGIARPCLSGVVGKLCETTKAH